MRMSSWYFKRFKIFVTLTVGYLLIYAILNLLQINLY